MQPQKPELAERLELAGLTFTLTDSLGLMVTPASTLTPTMREEIKAAKAALVDWLLALKPPEPFTEPPGYEGTGWRLAGADGLSTGTLAKFYAASRVLNAMDAGCVVPRHINNKKRAGNGY